MDFQLAQQNINKPNLVPIVIILCLCIKCNDILTHISFCLI